eukprot:TRINITY_DN19147_c0_g1_i1.p1 TRINITY_DN19147_c0_g1~~TRINITY_DN19147_c0_g1_i1.p1  ORF type:complete len:389 (-),score=47.24 TRINITY_DN19147_c0_g1_i1:254-1420(-)
MSLVFAGSGFFGPSDLGGQIHAFKLDHQRPALTPIVVTPQPGTFPVWVGSHPSGKILYASETPSTDGTKLPGCIHAYSIDAHGVITTLGEPQCVGGTVPCHFSILNEHLLVANYGEVSGGSVAALPINPDGSLSPHKCMLPHGAGIGGHPSGRQDESHPHMFQATPDGNFAFVCDLGTNSIWGYSLSDGVLSKCSELALHAGAGPRHISFSQAAPFALVLNELDNTCVPLRYNADNGVLSEVDTLPDRGMVSVLPEGTPGASGGGACEIVISQDGRFGYASIRSCGEQNAAEEAVFNSIAVLELDTETGAVKLLDNISSGGNMPWAHAFAGTNDDFLLVGNQHAKHESEDQDQGSGVIVVFHRDTNTGLLIDSGARAEVQECVSLCVV